MSLIPTPLRESVAQRAGNRCEYCLLAEDWQVATFPVDHVLPISLGGPTDLDNLALACPRCNAAKWKHVAFHNADTGQDVPLYNPRAHQWSDHFRWSDADSTVLEPLSAIGQATILLLDLNSEKHRTVRSLLRILALHPPVEQSR